MFLNYNIFILISTIIIVSIQSAKLPKEEIVDNKVHQDKLSNQPHYTDLDNDNKFEHNSDYDHEAFLGKDEADKFKDMTPEESKEKLGLIVDKIDKNRDNFVSENELRNWIRMQHKIYMQKNTNKKWKKVNTDKDDSLTFDELIDNTIGQPDTWTEEEKEQKKDQYKTYLKLMERDKKRFKAADADGDGKLNKQEYAHFLHPEENKSMRDIVIDETMEDLDKNNDGVINIDEFIADLYSSDKTEEPDWLQNEKENFKLYRDKNKDNVLDREEVANWILPTDFDQTLNEAKHLIHEADANNDGKLTKEEIIEKYSVFVASQATGFGEAIYEREDL